MTNDDDEDFDVDVDSESLDEQSLAVAIKGDPGNQANQMITNIYKMNNNASSSSGTSISQQATRTSPIHLNTSSMPTSSAASSASLNKDKKSPIMNKKEVRFETSNDLNETRKRKPESGESSSTNNAKTSRSDTLLQLNGSDRFKNDSDSPDSNKSKKIASTRKCTF